ncbi:MAG TPA: helix-turn-helix domain-containing protein [Sphingomonadaceae bacterium]|jgi:hypothetical protein|nr:helix-turn-helix domain-containing protein [Sphingomonadaceae bacterium]
MTGDETEILTEQTERIRASGALGRSSVLAQLFDFLLQRTLAGQPPKEVEIAHALFSPTAEQEAPDASVRVYIHRLRRKLADYYLHEDPLSAHVVTIPKGDYRLHIAPRVTKAVPPDAPASVPPPHDGHRPLASLRRWIGPAGWGLLALAIIFWAISPPPMNASQLAAAKAHDVAPWRGLGEHGRPVLIVVGDYYIFGGSHNGMDIDHLIREFDVNTPADLNRYIAMDPDNRSQFQDVGLYYLPVGAAEAIRRVAPLLDAGAGRPTRTVPMSELMPDQLKSTDIVYVGYLSGLGLLRDAVFRASRLSVGQSYDELIDRKTGKRYTAEALSFGNLGGPRRDYSYIAAMPGPNGNRIVVIAGTRDVALQQAAELATDSKVLEGLRRRVGDAASFEALYEVQGIGNTNVGGHLVFAGATKAGRVWRSEPAVPETFPDQMPK